jgi:hypothetical protein
MLDAKLDPKSLSSTVDYMQTVKQRILAAVRSGMAEGMELLAENTVAELYRSGIQRRTGVLEENILSSPRVTEDANVIRGRVTAKSLVKAKGGQPYYNNLGNMLDLGFHDPAVGKEPMHQITEPDGGTFWARGHVAFDVKPHPFFRRAVEVSESPIMELIRSRVSRAAEE